jgi:hypothetical protein
MRGLRLTIFILVFLSLTAELIRHSYVRWIENHTSVLDKYDEVDKEIKEATSIAALEKRYAEELEKQNAAKEHQPSAQFNRESPPVSKLRQAIADWERRENEIRELRYSWAGGLACLLLALVCHWRGQQWVSVTLQIAGFAEMTWWTSPSLGLVGAAHEYTRLLDNKITFTVLAFALLLVFWFTGVLGPEAKRHRPPT